MSTPVLRPATSDDLPAIHSVLLRAEAADDVARVMEFDEMCEELDDARIPFATHVRVAEVHGDVVGYVYALHLPSEVKEERCYLFGNVDPAHRGLGVGRALMTWGIGQARSLLESTGRDLPRHVRLQISESATSAHALMGAMGFGIVRYIDELIRPLDDVAAMPAPAAVDGITIVPWPDGRDEEIRREKNDAFMDHWGSTPSSVEDWHAQVHGFGARPDLSFVALDDEDRVVAHALNHRYEADDELLGRSEAWIDSLGTLEAWRGRGVASALIVRSLQAFAEAGLTHAALAVDSENPTGASRLYRSLGFGPSTRSIVHDLAV
ncbi:MAG: GNAT family N-acetyltransferase [Ilumatobacter sp.]|uniref:GNAT family N-acetyltransferase n=1 Tax=Ilumatobacter sp. TaxID=1967498 RepID=UPI003297F6D4